MEPSTLLACLAQRVVYERIVVVGGAVVLRIEAERISAETFAGN